MLERFISYILTIHKGENHTFSYKSSIWIQACITVNEPIREKKNWWVYNKHTFTGYYRRLPISSTSTVWHVQRHANSEARTVVTGIISNRAIHSDFCVGNNTILGRQSWARQCWNILYIIVRIMKRLWHNVAPSFFLIITVTYVLWFILVIIKA